MKISDFKIAEFILRKLCKQFGCHFVDLDVELPLQLDRFGKTIFYIVSDYINRIDQINGSPLNLDDSKKTTAINTTVAMIRDYTTGQIFEEGTKGLPTVLKLNRDPLVWLLMRDIVCPAFSKPLNNLRIVAGSSAFCDTAKLVEFEKMTTTFTLGQDDAIFRYDKTPFVFVNMQVENYPVRVASIFVETVRAHDLNPKNVVKDLLTKTELSDKFFGLTKMALGGQEAFHDFIMSLGILIDMDDTHMLIQASNKRVKKAQMGGGQTPESSHSSFWQLGLIEKMLEPMRGNDWTPYFTMKQFTDKLWDKIEQEKRKRGLPELSLEQLLRVQSDKYKQRTDLITQALLDDNRVW